jgi:VIT1/CCC1 family predicted Fe2+/Mn2+ transporter
MKRPTAGLLVFWEDSPADKPPCREAFYRLGIRPRCCDWNGRRFNRAVCVGRGSHRRRDLKPYHCNSRVGRGRRRRNRHGAGGYLAARTDEEHYSSEEHREHQEIQQLREVELDEVSKIFRGYGLEGQVLEQVTGAIAADPKQWVNFMMRFELGLERPDPKRALVSAVTIAISYIVGGLIPLVPYILGLELHRALVYSVIFTGIALALFGAVKGRLTGISMVKSAFQTTLVGGIAARNRRRAETYLQLLHQLRSTERVLRLPN